MFINRLYNKIVWGSVDKFLILRYGPTHKMLVLILSVYSLFLNMHVQLSNGTKSLQFTPSLIFSTLCDLGHCNCVIVKNDEGFTWIKTYQSASKYCDCAFTQVCRMELSPLAYEMSRGMRFPTKWHMRSLIRAFASRLNII